MRNVFPVGAHFPPTPIPNNRFPRAWYIESTEKVEKRDFRAVGNGYKPPQDFYDFMVFLWFRLWEWFLMRWYIADCYRNMPKACPYVMMKSQIQYDLLPRNHFIIRSFSPWNGERFLSLGQMRSIPRCSKAVFCFWFHSRFGNNA